LLATESANPMKTLIEKGEETISRLQGTSASIDIVYRRGEEACRLSAVVGQTMFEIDGSFGAEAWTSRDYIVKRADLVFSAGRFTPQRGDRIWQMRNGTTYIYETKEPGDQQCFQHSGETRFRIHTMLVEEL